MDIREIRRDNLVYIANTLAKSKQMLAEKLETSPSYLSQMLSATTKANVGDDLARRLERAFNLDHGWMDKSHDPSDLNIEDQREEYSSLESQLTEEERDNIMELMKPVIAKRAVLNKLL